MRQRFGQECIGVRKRVGPGRDFARRPLDKVARFRNELCAWTGRQRFADHGRVSVD
jgi:hypothetical protein